MASVAGALLLLKFVKILLPEGSIKNYVSITVSSLVILIMIASVTGNLTKIPQSKDIFNILNSMFNVNFTIPQYAQFSTVIGAALSAWDD